MPSLHFDLLRLGAALRLIFLVAAAFYACDAFSLISPRPSESPVNTEKFDMARRLMLYFSFIIIIYRHCFAIARSSSAPELAQFLGRGPIATR